MTSYNHERYLPESIESTLNQTFRDIELIIVDDASKDRSRDIILDYAQRDRRVRYIFHDTNRGISQTTNDGFDVATGKYIAYMQSDDVWFPHKLEKQYETIRQNPNVIVWSEAMIIDKEGNLTGQKFTEWLNASNRKKSGNLFFDLIKSNYICGQSVLFPRDYLRKARFDPRLKYLNDYKFFLDLSKYYPFHFTESPLVKYRIHGGNSILNNTAEWQKDYFRLQKHIFRNYWTVLPNYLRAKIISRIAKYLKSKNHFGWAKKYFLKSILLNPLKTTNWKELLA